MAYGLEEAEINGDIRIIATIKNAERFAGIGLSIEAIKLIKR